MQKSTKIAWTIVTLLIGGIVYWNLNTASATGKAGATVGIVMIAAIAGIWRWEPTGQKKDK